MGRLYKYFFQLLVIFIAFSQPSFGEPVSKDAFDTIEKIVTFKADLNGFWGTCLTQNSADTVFLRISFPFIDAVQIRIKSDDAEGILSRTCIPFIFDEKENSILLSTDSISVQLMKAPWTLDIYRKGRKLYSQTAAINISLKKIQIMSDMTADEHFYGFGEKFNGLDQRGKKVVMELSDAYMATDHRAYKSIPFFISSKRYGVLVNSPNRVVFHMGDLSSTHYQFENPAASIEYFIFTNENPLSVISQYADITGKPPIVPKWSLEPWLSRRSMTGWNNPATAEQDIDMLIKNDFRLGVVLWEGVRRMFEGEHAVEMHKLTDKWHGMGIKQVSWGYAGHIAKTQLDLQKINPSYFVRYADGAFCDGGFGGGKYYIDPTNPEAMSWWKEKYYTHRFANKNNKSVSGAWNLDGIKIDFCELFPKEDSDLLIHDKNVAMHNQHSVLFSKQIYDWLQDVKPDQGITWVRGGGLGIQTVGFSWGGDRGRTFEQMRGTVAASLGVSICGVSLIGHDLGGYRGDASPEARKVYIRGVQYATFSPSFHDHGSAPGPWEQDDYGRENYAFYSRVRYNILPYLDHYVRDSHKTGVPMMRALVLHHPTDRNTFTIEDEYYLGDNLLIAPIVTESDTRNIYLPAGQWIDFWNNEIFNGKQQMNYFAPLNRIPVFAKAGTILPLELNNALELGGVFPHEQKNNLFPTFRFFEGPDTELELYGKTHIHISKKSFQDQIVLGVENITQNFGLIVGNFSPGSVFVNGKMIKKLQKEKFSTAKEGWIFDTEKAQTLIKINSEPGEKNYSIKLSRVKKQIAKNEDISIKPPQINRIQGWDKSIDVYFTPVKNAESYTINYWQKNSPDKKEIRNVTSSPVTLLNLQNNKIYSITMNSVLGEKPSKESDAFLTSPEKHSPFFQMRENKILIRANHSLKTEVTDTTAKHIFGLLCPKKARLDVWLKAQKNEPHHRYFRWYKIGDIDVSKGENYFALELLKKSYDIDSLYFTENKNDWPILKNGFENGFEQKSADIKNVKVLQF